MLGFVDVPGHEKLVRNMLAGATGIDHVMLVVAADDGPMPQTREHLAILDLLGLSQGVVALTKCDLVTPERLAEAQAEVRALLGAQRVGRGADPAAVVGHRRGHRRAARAPGTGACDAGAEAQQGQFRLAVDRSFTLSGIGTVVTGTAVAGRCAGDRLTFRPAAPKCVCAASMRRTARPAAGPPGSAWP